MMVDLEVKINAKKDWMDLIELKEVVGVQKIG